MRRDYKGYVLFLPSVITILIVINCVFNSMILSMVSSIILLACSILYIKIYSDDKMNNTDNNDDSDEKLIVISTISLILSLGWMILNIFIFIIIQVFS